MSERICYPLVGGEKRVPRYLSEGIWLWSHLHGNPPKYMFSLRILLVPTSGIFWEMQGMQRRRSAGLAVRDTGELVSTADPVTSPVTSPGNAVTLPMECPECAARREAAGSG